jgi:hypothetical protein
MLASPLHAFPVVLVLALLCASHAAQQPESPQPEKTTLLTGIDRLAGHEAASRIQYVRLILPGSLRTAASATVSGPLPAPSLSPAPMLIAQCTLRPNGKSYFELFANFGGATDLTFYPPWTPTSPQDLFPPRTEKAVFTMEFLGYTHVKPVRRQWEIPVQTPGQYRYNPPGAGSSNLEEIAYYLRYLVSLPTLRLTLDNRSADFLTTSLLSEIRKEPLCKAAGL